jgi:hypothetical protein
MSLLELHWRQVAECRVQSACVVNLLDERRDTFNNLCKIPIFVEIDVLAFERLHKALGLGIGFSRRMRRIGTLKSESSE